MPERAGAVPVPAIPVSVNAEDVPMTGLPMTGHYARPALPYGGWSLFLARLSAMMLVISGLAHRFGYLETIGFFWVLGAIFLIAFAALCLSLVALNRLWDRGARGGRPAGFALAIASLVMVPYAVSAWHVITKPVLNDVMTDVEDPPVYILATGMRSGAQNRIVPPFPELEEVQKAAYPDVTGRRHDAAPDRVLTAVQNVIEKRGWTIVARNGAAGETNEIIIEARAWSPILCFPADVVIRIADEGERTFVDMRSSSLYANHDLGDNARRITRFMSDLEAEMLLLAGT